MNQPDVHHTDVVVIGAGHAGCEAALIAQRLGAKVVVITLRVDGIGQMSCNPAIGGVGKGHLVREIDALGGAMAEVADATGIQFRRLNASRGPAVRSTRVQSDSKLYQQAMAQRLMSANALIVIEGEATAITMQANARPQVILADGRRIVAGAVVVTTGTFLQARCHMGDMSHAGGRQGDRASGPLSVSLRTLGLSLGRFKTGTTPRLSSASINFAVLDAQAGDVQPPMFSRRYAAPPLPQVACHLTYTTDATHRLVADNLHRSALYVGQIVGKGPRYCPSLEDKVVRFADKPRHSVFLEPEGLTSDRIYPNGLSTSLPPDIQQAFIRTVPGLEAAQIVQHGYAVEYDYAHPTQLSHGLMVKKRPGLFLAGQINGTSGYEEAAAQGLMAGINAVRWLGGDEPAVIDRQTAYIGVLIDDIVSRGVDEPYRVFTSRAEHRMTLRESNADRRLVGLAQTWGTLKGGALRAVKARLAQQDAMLTALDVLMGPALSRRMHLDASAYAGLTRRTILKRPEVTLHDLCPDHSLDAQSVASIEEQVKYEGYIAREARQIARAHHLERICLPSEWPVEALRALSGEIKEKLLLHRPETLGQAAQIQGMTPVALTLLRVHAKKYGSVAP